MNNTNFASRLNIIIILLIVLSLACIVRLFDLQVVKGSEYESRANERLYRAYSVPAPRGEMLDCNDKPMVENRMGCNIQIQKIDISEADLNRVLYDTAALAAAYGNEIDSLFPIIKDEKGNLTFDFTIAENGGTREVEGVKPISKPDERSEKSDASDDSKDDKIEKTEEELRLEEQKNTELLEKWKKENKISDLTSAERILEHFKRKYSVTSEFSDDESLTVTAIRYAMEKSGFSEKNPYTLARDVGEIVPQQIKEQFMRFPGVEITIEPVRVFTNGTMAAHILGRTDKIYAEEYAEMKDEGYGMNDIIGKDGLEKVLEKYLKGKDGYKSVEMNRGGGVTQILESRDPKPGNFARLTLNSDLQRVMEKALRNSVIEAVGNNGAGAAIAVNPKTGGILATASYPTYDLTTYTDDYNKLLNAKSKPLINRVLNGVYSPGSTFKPLTSVAALETGVITPNTYIVDKGKYTYYDSYQPTCLIYSSSGATHGTINVSEAIGVSCNYFFYDVGRRTGIDVIDDYATRFGLGQNTGIELPESLGILASPEEREKAGGTWYPGDVLQAAIGQSDNMFTPAQLASYVSTIVNRGKRYSLHLVNEVVDYDSGEVIYRYEPKLLSDNPISDSTYLAVCDGMRRVVTEGTASSVFATSKYKAAGKTGTAEVPDGADNVLFVGFAPYDNPEIVIAVVIEHGAKSSFAAQVARKVFDAYMQMKDGTFESEQNETKDESVEEKPVVQSVKPGNSEGGKSSSSGSEENSGVSGRRPENLVPDSSASSEGEGTL